MLVQDLTPATGVSFLVRCSPDGDRKEITHCVGNRAGGRNQSLGEAEKIGHAFNRELRALQVHASRKVPHLPANGITQSSSFNFAVIGVRKVTLPVGIRMHALNVKLAVGITVFQHHLSYRHPIN
jgi:hypothetical protein